MPERSYCVNGGRGWVFGRRSHYPRVEGSAARDPTDPLRQITHHSYSTLCSTFATLDGSRVLASPSTIPVQPPRTDISVMRLSRMRSCVSVTTLPRPDSFGVTSHVTRDSGSSSGMLSKW